MLADVGIFAILSREAAEKRGLGPSRLNKGPVTLLSLEPPLFPFEVQAKQRAIELQLDLNPISLSYNLPIS